MSLNVTNGNHQHTHDHDHPHSHGPGTATENYSARKHPEFVVMNVGGGLGGLIVHTDPELHGEEIEISVTGADDQRTHKDILERTAGNRPAFTAVFDGLPTGHYTLWNRDRPRQRDVEIVSGQIIELDWRTTS